MEDLTDIGSVINAVRDQQETIGLLQVELAFQKDRIDKQELIIKELTTKVEDLSIKLAAKTKDDENIDTTNIWKGTANLSIAEAVKETAEQALMNNLGFVFDPNTRLYCNYSTGYYYDPGQELFYNGHTGIYYTYDADNQNYIFHSQVNIEQPKPDVKSRKADDKKTSRHKLGKSKSKTSNPALELVCSPSPQSIQDEDNWDAEPSSAVGRIKSKPKVKTKLKSEQAAIEDMEEGELSEGSSSSSVDDVQIVGEYYSALDLDNSSSPTTVEEVHPPCIRAIVLETCSPAIKKGSLFLVTCMGGAIGREDAHPNTIVLPDSSVDKQHAIITYSLLGVSESGDEGDNRKQKKAYFINDSGSSSGTFLNGTRLPEPQESNGLHEIVHGSIVKIGGFSILMHIHPGSFTCGHCEPGLLMESSENISFTISQKTEKPKTRNALMKQIKKKYGLTGRTPVSTTLSPTNPQDSEVYKDRYKDRANERRVKKGSDNPYEKTQVVTSEDTISESNKGFKMLSKMGWKEGHSLGNPDNKGLIEPIKLELKTDRAGLGMVNVGPPALSSIGDSHKKKGNHSKTPSSISKRGDHLAITMKRFKEASEVKIEVIDVEETCPK